MSIINLLRKNIGTIVAAIGFMLLCILTFGDLGSIVSVQYWENVRNNLTSISFMTIGLTLVQVAIKQGVAEQALQRGLNTEQTAQKYAEHKSIMQSNNSRMIYLPYFLRIYNRRHTEILRHEFLMNNGFASENTLYSSNKQKLIDAYRSLTVNITTTSIKWSTVEIAYNKYGRIETLEEYRVKRLKGSLLISFVCMIGVTFITGGLFFSPSDEPLWEKFVRLFTYILTIALSAVFTTVKEYEKGAFSVPNELDEINQIWREFSQWEPPQWVLDEVEHFNEGEKTVNERENNAVEFRTNLQEKQENEQDLQDAGTDNVVSVVDHKHDLCDTNAPE